MWLEPEAALLTHFTAYHHYYRFVSWRATDPSDQVSALARIGSLNQYVHPQALGYVGPYLAFPVRLDSDPALEDWVAQMITENKALANLGDTQIVTLPTPGLTMETRLGACDGCEEYLLKQRDIELQLRQSQLELAHLEEKRYALRLSQPAPQLDDPTAAPGAILVILEQPKP